MVEEMRSSAFESALELILYLFIDKVIQSEPHLQQKLYELADVFVSTLPDLMRDQLRQVS